MRSRYLQWSDVNKIVSRMVAHATGHFDAVIAISRDGTIPAGLICKRLDIQPVYIASVRFFRSDEGSLSWPIFLQFPEDELLRGKRILVVDAQWETGQAINSVRERIETAEGQAMTAVLHYHPGDSVSPYQLPEIIGEQTEDLVVYPWQAERDMSSTARAQ